VTGEEERPARTDVSESQGVLAGDQGVQVNVFRESARTRAVAAAMAGGVGIVLGDVPQEPAAFLLRAGLMETLERQPAGRVVFALTGIRGVGKTQVAAAYARRRITEGWRLVAWVDASDEAKVLAGLAQVATTAGVGPAGEDARVLAAKGRHWLEADGERRLLVLDNVVGLEMLRPFLPAGGRSQVIVTSTLRSAGSLGKAVQVDVFSESEALAFLAERTGLGDEAGARELAVELGWLPLGLAQAAALIARERLDYGTYLGRLRSLPVAGYLRRADGDPYPYRLAEAIELSLGAAEAGDPSGVRAVMMGLVAVLAETGVPRGLLHLAAEAGVLGDGTVPAEQVDEGIGDLADASLLGFSVDGGSVAAHRLVMRVARERLAARGALPGVLTGAVQVLTEAANAVREPWRDPAGIRELAGQMSAVTGCLASHSDALAGEELADLLRLRLRLVYLLNELGDSTGLAIAVAEPLVADCEQLLGADHPDTLASRNNLAMAYHAAGRTGQAVALLERTLADRERLLGADHPDTLASRNNLAEAYHAAGRTGEAVVLLERMLGDCERLLGADHPDTLQSHNNLAAAYRAAGRTGEAVDLHERTLAGRERLLGPDHPHTLQSRNNLAMAYHAAGRTGEAVVLLERTLADRERLLDAAHPETLASRNNLAMAYQAAGRTAEAVDLHERTLADRERLLGTNHPHTLTSRNNLAAAYQAAGRTAEAVVLLERALADCERLLGGDHPGTLQSCNNLAMAYQAAKRRAEAVVLLERALADCERLLGADHPNTKVVRDNLAAVT
jgi:tetratricopeptide (TPR) repeat protein